MKMSPSSAPAMARMCFGRPTNEGKKHFGRSSPANPARMVPLPLSSTMGAFTSLVLTDMVGKWVREGEDGGDASARLRWLSEHQVVCFHRHRGWFVVDSRDACSFENAF